MKALSGKPKKCAQCKIEFVPTKTGQKVCGFDCAIDYGVAQKWKKHKAETRAKKAKLNDESRAYWLAKAQKAVNASVRVRDYGKPCISCGVPDGQGKRNAGHYRPAGINAQHRFNPLNIHGQCERCNTSLSGNLIPYRVELIRRIGSDAVDALEMDNTVKKWSIAELKDIYQFAINRTLTLKNEML